MLVAAGEGQSHIAQVGKISFLMCVFSLHTMTDMIRKNCRRIAPTFEAHISSYEPALQPERDHEALCLHFPSHVSQSQPNMLHPQELIRLQQQPEITATHERRVRRAMSLAAPAFRRKYQA